LTKIPEKLKSTTRKVERVSTST